MSMKLKRITTFLFAVIAIVASATQYSMPMKYHRRDTNDKPIIRTPMHMPIEVIYDSDTQYVYVECNGDVDAEVYLYDASGNVEGYSSTIDASFYVPAQGSYTIIINSDGWSAEGSFEI